MTVYPSKTPSISVSMSPAMLGLLSSVVGAGLVKEFKTPDILKNLVKTPQFGTMLKQLMFKLAKVMSDYGHLSMFGTSLGEDTKTEKDFRLHPYPVITGSALSVVTCRVNNEQHVLLYDRGGKLHLPGGYVKSCKPGAKCQDSTGHDHSFADNANRELHEEVEFTEAQTGKPITYTSNDFTPIGRGFYNSKGKISSYATFHHLDLGELPALPQVTGKDDLAGKAVVWIKPSEITVNSVLTPKETNARSINGTFDGICRVECAYKAMPIAPVHAAYVFEALGIDPKVLSKTMPSATISEAKVIAGCNACLTAVA